jgi:hypothetical protein
MRETIRVIDIESKATMASPAFAGGGADQRSVSRFFNADLVANPRAPPRPARSRHGRHTLSLDKGVHILDDRTVITPATDLRGLMRPGGWNVRASVQEVGPSGAA